MLPLKLEIENINSFTDRQTVDFSAVAGDGLFCISGDTGAGKTTILDSMIIALYGMGTGAKTTGGDRGGKDDYINVAADKAYVAFEFAFAGKMYRVERTFTRAGVHKAYLYCDGALVCQTATAVETAVKALLGLEKEQFTQVIVLEQGKFSKFLNAGPQARVRTVMKLFGLERFDMFSKVNKYFTELGHKLDVLNASLEAYAGDTDTALRAKKAELKEKTDAIGKLSAERAALAAALAAERDKAAAYAQYKRDEAAVAERKAQLDKAAAALAEWERTDGEALGTAAAAAAEKAAAARSRLDKANAASGHLKSYAKVTQALTNTRAAYRAQAEECKRLQGEAERVAADYAAAAAALDKANGALAPYRRLIPDGQLTPAALNTEAQVALNKARTAAAEYEKVSAERQAAEKELAAARAGWEMSVRACDAARKENDAAAAAFEAAQRQSAAAALTAGLKAGDKCPLCGGTLTEIPVSAGLDGYRAAAEAAARALREAESANAAFVERIRNAEKRLAGPVAAVPEAPLSDYAVLAEFAAEAARLADSLAGLDKKADDIRARKSGADEKLNALLKQGQTEKEQQDSWRQAVERELGTFAEGEAFEKLFALASAEAKAAAEESDRAAARVKERETESRRLTAEKAAAEGAYRQAVSALKAAPPADPDKAAALEKAAAEAETKEKELTARAGALGSEIGTMTARIETKRTIEKEKRAVSERYDTAGLLVKALKKGNNSEALVAFVAEEYIREITAGASARLNALTGGKYTLEYDGEFSVRDFFRGNRPRRVQTLSGGETFLASLSLAVAIADILSADKTYGFFFLDEGFGTLDENRIAGVAEALGQLSRDTLVGVVTHSPALMELIPARIEVLPASDGRGSRIAG